MTLYSCKALIVDDHHSNPWIKFFNDTLNIYIIHKFSRPNFVRLERISKHSMDETLKWNWHAIKTKYSSFFINLQKIEKHDWVERFKGFKEQKKKQG